MINRNVTCHDVSHSYFNAHVFCYYIYIYNWCLSFDSFYFLFLLKKLLLIDFLCLPLLKNIIDFFSLLFSKNFRIKFLFWCLVINFLRKSNMN
jgi:hypothetical protein